MVLPDSMNEDAWTYGVAATIEEFETAEGATVAFDAFNDPDEPVELTQSSSIEGGRADRSTGRRTSNVAA